MQQETSQDSWPVFKRLLGYVRDRKLGLIGGIIGMLGYAAVDTTFVYSIKPLIDQGSTATIRPCSSGCLSSYWASWPCAASPTSSNYCMAWVGNHVVIRLQQQVFNHMVAMPMSFFDRQNTGHLLSKVTYDASQVSSASTTLVTLVREGATVIGLLGLMFWHSWQLSVIFLVVGPVVGIIIGLISRRFRQISRHIQQAVGDITTSTEQMLKGHKEVLMFGGQKVEEKRFFKVSNNMRQQTMKMVAADAIGSPVVQMVASIALAAFLYVATIDSVRSELTAGTFTVMITSMMMLLAAEEPDRRQQPVPARHHRLPQPVRPARHRAGAGYRHPYPGARPRRDRVSQRHLHLPDQGHPGAAQRQLQGGGGQIGGAGGPFRLWQEYHRQPVDPLLRHRAGEILLDGVNIRDYRLSELRKQYALVSQHVHLFNDTVASNIAYAAEEKYSLDEIKQAARIAHADEFVSKMSNGYDTVVGENGASLSGGQRQRIAIARALLRDAPVLLLDEATSALDTESERHIQAAIDELCKARTSLVIAHRLSTIEKADEILVIDEGHIVERGNHAALMAQQGTYAQLRAIQFGHATAGGNA